MSNPLTTMPRSAIIQVAATLLFLTMATAVIAQPHPNQSMVLNGFYAGAHAGMGTGAFDSIFDSSEIPAGLPDDAVFGRFFEFDGFLTGLHAGYNQTVGSYVFGVELDWTHFGQSDQLFDPNDEGLGTTDNASATINWIASLRGRVGLISARSLIYTTGGIAWADANYTARNADDNNVNSGSANLSGVGYVVGGGIEHAVTSQLSIRLEGLYYGFNRKKHTGELTTDSDAGDFAELRNIKVARLGVVYRLNQIADSQHESGEPADWNGIYFGAHAGYSRVGFDSLFDGDEIDRVIDTEDSVLGRFFDLDGAMGGIHFGYNQVDGRFVYGLEADWSYLGKSDRVFDPDLEPGGTDNATMEVNWLASLRGRIGVTSARSLFYATAGAAWVSAKYTVEDGDRFTADRGSTNINAVGFVFGGGIEHALNDNTLLRFEALHYDFSKRKDTSILSSDSDAGDYAKIDDVTIIRIGASYKFNLFDN